jgi:LPXTG-motif cell wall-anchored protein
MKNLRLALAVVAVAFFSVLASSPAQAYPIFKVVVSEDTVTGGDDITIAAHVEPPVSCDSWTLTFLGDTRNGSGPTITETFSTPEVDNVEHHDAVATCVFDNPNPSAASAVGGSGGKASLGTSLVQFTDTITGVGVQTLLPEDDGGDGDGDSDGDGGDGGGILPNTGGERLAWLVIGGMLVLVGGGVVVASRRRDA